jgi:hypothetical protein
MEIEGLAELTKYVGQEVKEVQVNNQTLTLGFEKKILFIKKMAHVVIDSNEALTGLSVGSLLNAVLSEATFDGIRLKMKFTREGAPSYTLTFKAISVEKA